MSPDESKSPKPKRRRWLQFSLRSMLVFTFLVAVFLGWRCHEIRRTRQEEQAVEAIYASGGYVMYKHDPAIFHRADPPGPAWMKRVLGEYFFARLDLVVFPPGLEDAQLLPLSQLRGSERLRLRGTALTDATLARVVEFKDLTELDLTATDVSDAGVASLRRMHRLKSLFLAFTPITDRAVEVLCEMPSLELVDLAGTHVSEKAVQKLETRIRQRYAEGTSPDGDTSERRVWWMPLPSERERQIFAEVVRRGAGVGGSRYFRSAEQTFAVSIFQTRDWSGGRQVLPLLPNLTSLSELSVFAMMMDNDDIEHLGRIPNLKYLDLSSTPITTAQWKPLAGDDPAPAGKADAGADNATCKPGLSQHLEMLIYNHAPMTDADLEQIAKFTKLTWLDLGETPVTDAGLTHLETLTKLQYVNLYFTQVTREGVEALRSALPGVDISWHEPPQASEEAP